MKTRFTQIVCLLLTAALMIGLFPLSASAESTVISGQFTYMPSFVDSPSTDTYYYSDEYLTVPSSQQNVHMTTMSMVLALASMEIMGDSYVTALLEDIGYTDVCTQDMTVTPTRDTIGTAIAHKSVDGHDVVAVSVRGNKYEGEWVANLIAGAEGNIEGFDTAANKVISRIKDYISAHSLTNVKLWIAGYSRGGSVADLTGVYINEHPDEFDTSSDDIFVYCFEAPRCCASDKIYDNIYCVRNKNDLITYVYPEAWGLYTNGVEIVTGEDLTVSKLKIDLFDSEKVVVLGEVPMAEFNEELISFIADELTREKFSGEFDDAVAELIELYFSKSSSDWSGIAEFFSGSDILSSAMDNDLFLYILMFEAMNGVMLHNSDKMYRQFTDELLLMLDDMGVTAKNLGLTSEEYNTISKDLYPILRAVGPLFIKDYKYKEKIDYSSVFPEWYNDPEFDPQTALEPILTYLQYIYMQENRPDEPEEEQSEEDIAWSDAFESDAYDRGVDDAMAGREPITESPLPEDHEQRSELYLSVYAENYLQFYMDGYANGLDQLDPKSDEYYDGSRDGEQAALADAKKDAFSGDFMGSYSETPAEKEDGTQYSDDYLLGYATAYRDGYEMYYESSVDYYKELNLYHLGSFVTQIKDIIIQHYPQTNWALVKSMDPYYENEPVVGDSDGDGMVTILDATRVQRWIADLCDMDGSAYTGAVLTTAQLKAADADGDGEVTILDATRIQRQLAGLEDIVR